MDFFFVKLSFSWQILKNEEVKKTFENESNYIGFEKKVLDLK